MSSDGSSSVTVITDDRDPVNRHRFVEILEEFGVDYAEAPGPYFQDTIATVITFPDGGMLTAPHTLRSRLEHAARSAVEVK